MPRLTDARVRDPRARKTTRNIRDTTLAGFGVEAAAERVGAPVAELSRGG